MVTSWQIALEISGEDGISIPTSSFAVQVTIRETTSGVTELLARAKGKGTVLLDSIEPPYQYCTKFVSTPLVVYGCNNQQSQ